MKVNKILLMLLCGSVYAADSMAVNSCNITSAPPLIDMTNAVIEEMPFHDFTVQVECFADQDYLTSNGGKGLSVWINPISFPSNSGRIVVTQEGAAGLNSSTVIDNTNPLIQDVSMGTNLYTFNLTAYMVRDSGYDTPNDYTSDSLSMPVNISLIE